MKKTEKGDWGYVNYRKKINLIIMLAAFAVVVGVFVLGLILNKMDRNNVFTVASVVLVLPAAKFAVAYFVVATHKSADESLKNKVEKAAGELTVCYDCIMSNKKKPICAQAVVVTDSVICAYTCDKKADNKLFETSLQEFMKNDKLNVTVTLYKEEKTFINRVKNLAVNFDFSKDSAKEKMEWNKNSMLNMCI